MPIYQGYIDNRPDMPENNPIKEKKIKAPKKEVKNVVQDRIDHKNNIND